MKSEVRVRFAPSPTGPFHLGGARTALFNYLFAKQRGGTFILRFDDTDRERSRPEFEENIRQGLDWLGLKGDEVYRQSERTRLYRQKLEQLIKENKAYISRETPQKAGEREEVIRLRQTGKKVSWTDLIKGEVSFDTAELGDFVIARDLDSPVYHFASVVDDIALNISHIIRGEDHLSNTPRQMLIAEALVAAPPQYAHIPLILAPDRSKLSKRHGATALTEYAAQGYLPAALVNFLATLGWSPQAAGLNEELLSLNELIKYFKLEQVQRSNAIFNLDKLNWFNKEYVKKLPEAERLERLKKEWPFFNIRPGKIDPSLLKTTEHLPVVLEKLGALPEADFTVEKIKNALWNFATEQGRDKVLWPLRVALTGRERSPDPFTVAAVLGKEETLARIRAVL